MSEELAKILNQLIKVANDFDEENDRTLQLGYSIEYACGSLVEVDVNLLRELRNLMESDRNA